MCRALFLPWPFKTQKREVLGRYVDGVWLPQTESGVSVTPSSAMALASVFACVRIYAQGVSTLPLNVYRYAPNGDRSVASDDPSYPLLHSYPVASMSKQVWLAYLVSSAELVGNAFAQAVRGKGGEVVGLLPIEPGKIRLKSYTADESTYELLLSGGGTSELSSRDLIHLRPFPYEAEGRWGLSPITCARECIGLGISAQNHGAKFFGNQARPSGVLTTPGKLKDSEEFKKAWKQANSGYGTAVLQEGMEFKPISMSATDSQWLESRKFSRSEIGSIFGISATRLGDTEKLSYASVEQEAISHVMDAIRPLAIHIEDEINRVLFPGDSSLKAEFSLDALLRGSTLDRYQAHKESIFAGFKTRNEIRKLENLSPLPGGDEALIPQNYATVGSDGVAKPISVKTSGGSPRPEGVSL